MIERTCKCGQKFMAKEADVKRGWAKSCSKSCAASATNKKTGNFKRYWQRREDNERDGGLFYTAHLFNGE